MTGMQQQSTHTGTGQRPVLTHVVLAAMAWAVLGLGAASMYGQDKPSDAQRTEWFRQARFGVFVHWGIYSVPAGEWQGGKNHAEWIMLTGKIPSAEYEKFATQFNPVKFNGESIYGTTASPLAQTPWGRCTAKPDKLYLHVFNWPGDGRLLVPGLRNKVSKAYLLAAKDQPCQITQNNEQVTVTVPQKAPDPIDSVVVLEIEGK